MKKLLLTTLALLFALPLQAATLKIATVTPHMHYRGKDMIMKAVLPDGTEKVLVSTPKYDFNWQTVYELEEPLDAPKGTKIEVIAHFDNSEGNLANPDPTKNVRFGNSSFDEMMIGFVDYIVEVDDASGANPSAGR